MQAAKQFIQSLGFEPNNDDFVALKELCQSNPAFTLPFAKFRFNQNITMFDIIQLYRSLVQHRQILNDLPQQVVQYDNFYALKANLSDAILLATVRKLVQQCPSSLKAVIRDNKSRWAEIANDCEKFQKQSKDNQRMFIRNISKYKSFDEIKNGLTLYFKGLQSGLNYFELTNDLENDNGAYIRYNQDGIIIARIKEKRTMQRFGAGSEWCIADRRSTYQNYWPEHVKDQNHLQYIVWNFNETKRAYQTFAFTVGPNMNVEHCHLWGNSADNASSLFRDMGLAITNTNVFSTEVRDLENGVLQAIQFVLDLDNAENMQKALKENLLEDAFKGTKFSTRKITNSLVAKLQSMKEELDKEVYVKNMKHIYKQIGSTPFFNFFIADLNLLTVEDAQWFKDNELDFKYPVHLEELINTHCEAPAEPQTKEDVVTIDGVQYTRTITLTPIPNENAIKDEVLNILLSTNEKVVSPKVLTLANSRVGLETFKVLVNNFNGKARKIHEFKDGFREVLASH